MENNNMVVQDDRIRILDVVHQKNEMEKKRTLSGALAACFSEASEMLRSNPHVFRECQLVLQAEGESVTIKTKYIYRIHILWFDKHKQAVQYDDYPC